MTACKFATCRLAIVSAPRVLHYSASLVNNHCLNPAILLLLASLAAQCIVITIILIDVGIYSCRYSKPKILDIGANTVNVYSARFVKSVDNCHSCGLVTVTVLHDCPANIGTYLVRHASMK